MDEEEECVAGLWDVEEQRDVREEGRRGVVGRGGGVVVERW